MFESWKRKVLGDRGKAKSRLPEVPRDERLSNHEDSKLVELEKPIENIVEQLSEDVEKGAYSVIIGDDASGRVPSLILAATLKRIYEARGFKPPLLRFIAGSSRIKDQESGKKKREAVFGQITHIKEDVAKVRGEENIGKALVVTDIIETGESVHTLVDQIEKNAWKVDVAALFSNVESLWSGTSEIKLIQAKSFAAEGIYGERYLSGVSKRPDDLFSVPFAALIGTQSDRYDAEVQSKVNATRAVADVIAFRIATRYLEKHPG